MVETALGHQKGILASAVAWKFGGAELAEAYLERLS